MNTKRSTIYGARLEPDGDDAHVLELAVAAKCDYIVTYNKRDFTQAAQFGVEIKNAAEFLLILT